MKSQQRMWMVRCAGGEWFDAFIEGKFVAVNGDAYALNAKHRDELVERYLQENPLAKPTSVTSWMSQRWRFIHDLQKNDWVVTYSSTLRVYAIGQITGNATYHQSAGDDPTEIAIRRTVDWASSTIPRDSLKASTKNTLGSVLTVFEIKGNQQQDILSYLPGATPPPPKAEALHREEEPEEIADPWEDIETQALERIKDLVAQLDWSEMQDLVAGILRAMGYKTQVSPAGPDRGKDIIASPDGFGFENPRIVVEVKHRQAPMGSSDLRSFLGGRHDGDRGLYVSTGGFTSDAKYEAERARIPFALWTLDDVVRALMEHYDATDSETKRLVPLKRLYWPA